MTLADALPTVNAALNAASAASLLAARAAIRAGRRDRHRALALAAVGMSLLFAVSYLTRVALTGTHRYPAHDWTRPLYLAILGSHTLLAAVAPFLVGRAIWLARAGRFAEHKRVVRWAFPVWLYVSVTGVVVYGMLYVLAPAR